MQKVGEVYTYVAQYFLSHLARDYGGYTCFCADVILHT